MNFNELIKAPLANLWCLRNLALVLRYSNISKDDLVLDVGCGTGLAPFILSKHAKEVIGIDISKPLIEFLNENLKLANARFLVADATKKPFDFFLATFNKCICIDVLEHVENPLASLEYIHKVLKPGGTAAITFPINKLEHGRNHFTLEDVHNLLAKVDMRADIRVFKQSKFGSLIGSVPKVVEKGIGISYPIEKQNKQRATPGPQKKGGYADGERIPQRTRIDHVRAGVIAGRACRPTAGAIRPGGGKAAVDRSRGRRGD
jgi:SAM-dependent methyltransferase